MLNFGDAFGFLFKEKNWVLKFLIPILPILLSGILAFLSILPVSTSISSSQYNLPTMMRFRDGSLAPNYIGIDNFGSLNYSAPSVLSLSILCFAIFIGIISAVISLWYQYEVTQSGIEKRETKPLWKEDPVDVIKKSAKTFLVTLLYWIIPIVLLVIGSCFVGLFSGMGAVRIFSTVNTTADLATALNYSALSIGALFLIMLCVVIALFFYQLVIVQPALFRLYATNTFSEGLNATKAFNIGKKYWLQILLALVVMMIVSFIVTVPFSVATTVLQILFKDPTIGIVISGFFSAIVTVLGGYLSIFVTPRLLGGLVSKIKEKEGSI